MYEAARLGDPVAHTSALAGFLMGALIGIALIAAVAFATFTCGFGAALLAGLASGLAAEGIVQLGEAIGSRIETVTGAIACGSPDVFINGKPAAHVKASIVACSKHPPVQMIAEGSSNIFINGEAAARKADHSTCDAKIGAASSNVHLGGGQVQYLPIHPEIPDGLRTGVQIAFLVAGLAGGLAGLARNAAKMGQKLSGRCATKFIAGQLAGIGLSEAAAYGAPSAWQAMSGLVGHPVEVTSGRKVILPETDFTLAARLPVSASRFYSSTLREAGLLGPGWRLGWEIALRRTDTALIFIGHQGREIPFPLLEPGHTLYDASEQCYLSRLHDGRYVMHTLEREHFLFGDCDATGLARLATVEGPHEQRIHLKWDDAGRLEAIRADGGYRLGLHYETMPAGQVRLARVDLLEGGTPGALVRYEYDANGYLASVADRSGEVVRRFQYHDGLMTRHVNAAHWVCTYRWETIDGQPRVVEHTTTGGEHYRFRYDFAAGRTEVTDVFGHVARWDFDEQQQIAAHTGFDGRSSRYAYDEAGWPVALHLPGDRVLRVTYDALARPVEVTDALGQTTRTDWHASTNLVRQTTLPDGGRWRTRFNDHHQPIETIDPLGRCTRTRYAQDGQLEAIADPRGGVATFEYDARGQLTAHTDCSGKTTRYRYTADGLLDSIDDALGRTTLVRYDPAGRPSVVLRPDRSQEIYRWDALGQIASHTNAAGYRQYWERDGAGRLLRHTDAAGHTVRYTRDAHGRPIALTNGNGASYRFSWDPADRLVREQRVDGTVHAYHYGAAGFLTGLVRVASDGSQRDEVHRRDALGRLVERAGEHSRTQYRYNPLGQLLEAARTPTDAGAALGIDADTVSFSYDAGGQLLAEHGVHGTLGYERDALGHPLAVSLPQGERIETLYYGSGHVHQMRFGETVIADFERDDLHREILRTQGRLTTHTGYTLLGQIAWQRAHRAHPARQEIPEEADSQVWRRYAYSASDELTAMHDRQGHTHYEYDRAGQIVRRVADGFDIERFAWDAAGNLLDDAANVASSKLPPLMDNLLRQYRGTQYTYDAWGQVVRRNNLTLTWDAEGQLLSVRDAQRQTRYRYDALGRRIAKLSTPRPGTAAVRGAEETRFVWQGLRLVQEQDEKACRTWLYDPSRAYAPLACVDHAGGRSDGTIYHYHADATGTPREVTDETGALVWQASYGTWGQLRANLASADGFSQPLRMPGQYQDDESGLHYNLFRYYDPHAGRFVSSDPIGLGGGLNLYQYALNPIGWIDPLGLANNPLSGTPLGDILELSSERTGKTYQGQQIFKITKKVTVDGIKFKPGDYYYLDGMHKDHIEAFSKNNTSKGVFNLDATLNEKKSARAADRTGPGC